MSEIARDLAFARDEIEKLFADLGQRDLTRLDDTTAAVVDAYPLTARTTEHRVTMGEHVLFALCAVDALGVGAMYGANVTINSSCRSCGAAIAIRTAEHGTAVGEAHPDDVMVWYDVAYEQRAATSVTGRFTLVMLPVLRASNLHLAVTLYSAFSAAFNAETAAFPFWSVGIQSVFVTFFFKLRHDPRWAGKASSPVASYDVLMR